MGSELKNLLFAANFERRSGWRRSYIRLWRYNLWRSVTLPGYGKSRHCLPQNQFTRSNCNQIEQELDFKGKNRQIRSFACFGLNFWLRHWWRYNMWRYNRWRYNLWRYNLRRYNLWRHNLWRYNILRYNL